MEITSQLAIFLENKPGALGRVCETLLEDDISILAVSVADGVDHAVVRLVVDAPSRAIHLLEERGILVSENDVILLNAKNRNGMLLEVTRRLSRAKVNIEYLYFTVRSSQKVGVMVLRPSNVNKAVAALQDLG